MTKAEHKTFQNTVRSFYKKHGRHDLPWRKKSTTPYQILVSEIMLQQTQVARVIPKYKAFLKSFPTVKKLSEASSKDVLAHWVGLGYNRRAINIHKAAQAVMQEHEGIFPNTFEALRTLPGIGPYTAGAICAFAFNKPVPILETNIRTVLIHHFFSKQKRVSEQALLELAEATLDTKNPKEWYWALMDYGSHLKSIHGNLSKKATVYTKQSAFKGSIREIRGAIIRILSKQKSAHGITAGAIEKETGRKKDDVQKALIGLEKDGLLLKEKLRYRLR